MKRSNLLIPFIAWAIFSTSCQKAVQDKTAAADTTKVAADPLASWNDTPTKKAIVDFVTSVTTEGNPKFVPVEERIATFDNDGTLWCEQPLYFEVVYSLASTAKVARNVPALMKKPEIKALAAGDMKAFMKTGERECSRQLPFPIPP